MAIRIRAGSVDFQALAEALAHRAGDPRRCDRVGQIASVFEDTDYFPEVPWKTKFTGSLRIGIVLEADLEIAIANIDVKVVQIFRYVAIQGVPNQHIESTIMIGTWGAPGFDDRTLADRKPVCSGPATRDADRADSTENLQSPSPCEFS